MAKSCSANQPLLGTERYNKFQQSDHTISIHANPGIRILLGSHTDCRGDDAYNDVLSEKRAKSAKDWLIEHGISSSRLESKGYGEREPSVNCKCEECTEAQHQLNRRTTFKIIRN